VLSVGGSRTRPPQNRSVETPLGSGSITRARPRIKAERANSYVETARIAVAFADQEGYSTATSTSSPGPSAESAGAPALHLRMAS
jgi:hypothetical protein